MRSIFLKTFFLFLFSFFFFSFFYTTPTFNVAGAACVTSCAKLTCQGGFHCQSYGNGCYFCQSDCYSSGGFCHTNGCPTGSTSVGSCGNGEACCKNTPSQTPNPSAPPGGGNGGTPPPTTVQSGSCTGGCGTYQGYQCGYDPTTQTCVYGRDSGALVQCGPPTTTTCTDGQLCYPGCGCLTPSDASTSTCVHPWSGFNANQRLPCGTNGSCPTAIGNINASAQGIVPTLFRILLIIGGALSLLLIIASGYRLITSQGNPEQVQGAREQLTAAIVGLLFIIFSFVLLQFIGVDILGIF